MSKTRHQKHMAAAGGAIPGGFFLARQARFAGTGKFCPANRPARENCIQNGNLLVRIGGAVGLCR